MRREISGAWGDVRVSVSTGTCYMLIFGSSGVFSVEEEEDISGETKMYGIIRSTDVIQSANATGEEQEGNDDNVQEDMIYVLWLYTTRYLEALTKKSTDLVENKQE